MTCLIMQEIGKLDVRTSVIPNGLEKWKSFTINKNLFYIDNMQYMNSMVMLYVSLYIDEFNIYIYIIYIYAYIYIYMYIYVYIYVYIYIYIYIYIY